MDDEIGDFMCGKCGGVVNIARRTCTCWDREIDLHNALVDAFLEARGAVLWSIAKQIDALPTSERIAVMSTLRLKALNGQNARY